MKIIKVMIIGFILTACGHAPVVNIHSEFSYYVDLFKEESIKQNKEVHINDLSIEFVDDFIEENKIGNCLYSTNKTPFITIKKDYWFNVASDELRQMLIFHELGHCILHRFLHEDTKKSIMNTYIQDDLYEHYDEYMKELFSNE